MNPIQTDLDVIAVIDTLREIASTCEDKAERMLNLTNITIQDRSALWRSLKLLAHMASTYADYLDEERYDFSNTPFDVLQT